MLDRHMGKKIIHCDADCFYAAVEMRDNPSLRNRPMAVGGSADKRGVISTCNYQARTAGVRSAMACAYAQRLCPNLLIVPVHMEKYHEASLVMRKIFTEYTNLVEPLSSDEAYLDASECTQHQGSATRIAEAIRQKIFKRVGITVSAGVANSKFLAKIASDWNKPNGLCVILPNQVDAFLSQLPVDKIHGVGCVTARKLHALRITTCGDLREYSLHTLSKNFGSFGQQLYNLARGIDHREVNPECIRKSLSVEHTYPEDLPDIISCKKKLPSLLAELRKRLSSLDSKYKISKAFVKIKFEDFTTTTLERANVSACLLNYQTMMEQAFAKKRHPVRLLGLGVRFWKVDQERGPTLQLDTVNASPVRTPTHQPLVML